MKQKNTISSAEAVTRYIFSDSHYAKTKERIKYHAFLPRNGETSIFRINNLGDEQIWDMGENCVALISFRTLLARGDLIASGIFEEGLEIKPDTRKHKLHANIVGWPLEEPGKVKFIATNLADKAQLHLKA
jgi:hypothetical protein